MKKLLLALVFGLLTLTPCYAQQGVRSHRFTIAGPDSAINLVNTAIAYHQITWNVTGTASACTVALDISTNGTTWSAGGAIAGQNCTSNGMSTVAHVVANYVRINMTALILTAGSSVTVTWDGYTSSPSGGGGVVGCSTTGGVAFENGTANTLTCDPLLTWDNTDKILNAQNEYVGTLANAPPDGLYQLAVVAADEGVLAPAGTTGVLAAANVSAATASSAALSANASSTGNANIEEVSGIQALADHGSSGTLTNLISIEIENDTDDGAGAVANSEGILIITPAFASTTPVASNIGIEIQDQATSIDGPSPTASTAILIAAQTAPGKAIVVEGGESDFQALSAATYSTATNCLDSAGAAACGSAAAGAVVIDAAATSVVVSTTAVTANSEIFVQYDSSLSTRLSVTCNTTVAIPAVTARTAGASFTITVPVAPTVNPACYSYHIVN